MIKQISLLKITLRNFKGIREFVLETAGESVSVYGDNAAGKTTLFDGFTWQLFDKDSQNKKDFGIKTLDKQGNVIHEQEHEVESVLVVNGKKKTLRKVFSEKWTKKRGSLVAELTGHETTYYIDGVPAKKGEYTDCIDELISEGIFKLLTSPTYFNEQMHWQDRRKTLLEVCGDISDAEVIGSDRELAKLTAILGDRILDDHRKVISSRKTQITKEFEAIPVRLQEARRSMPDVEGLDEEFLNDDIESLRKRIDEKVAELQRIQSGGEISVKENRIREIEGELLQLKNQLQGDIMNKIASLRETVNGLLSKSGATQRNIDDNQARIKRNLVSIESSKSEASRLRVKWTDINAEVFEGCQDENCPTCGQKLPDDQFADAFTKAVASFNLKKSERLADVSKQGKAAAAEVSRLEGENVGLVAEVGKRQEQLQSISNELAQHQSELDKLQQSMTDPTADKQYIQKQAEIDTVKKDIISLRSGNIEKLDKARMELSKLRSELDCMEKQRAMLAQAKVTTDRIKEITEQETTLIRESENLELELHLVDKFTRTKVGLLESKINSKFRYARFKLFEQQVNGGVAEVCETLYDGVPYSSGLNNAARINVGLDIINTLSEHYGFTAPIFIDNAEAVTKLLDTKGQQISLIVSEQDKQLRIERMKIMEAI